MNESLKFVQLTRDNDQPLSSVERFGPEAAARAKAFHSSFPEYQATPLVSLKELAKSLGVASIHVKDESYRFGLNAFKVLGGSYTIGNYIAQKLGIDISELPYSRLVSDEIKEKTGNLTFVTATDGNHGRGVAWTANRLGQKSVVYMPKGSAPERLENIRKLGADASITEFNYDDAVRLAKKGADENGWIMVQDTAWEGYEEIPGWIMEGYTTMALEATQQLQGEKPTHVFLQAGVGSMSGAITGYFSALYGDRDRPIITIVEPNKADCIYKTALANDGQLHFVTDDMQTIMAGLACGEPCTIGWDVLKDHADNFISMPDYVAAEGMRILGNPLPGDSRIISGESGAAAPGLVAEILRNNSLAEIKQALKLDEHSRILCFSTEGDTDKENYRKIVWDGLHPSF
ncbi:MAG: diaminopropionate ammonia-lyase [Eubacteriales bacterium]|nr:diaminopropionate ammonia-lyase [Eubacteriales bacterium]